MHPHTLRAIELANAGRSQDALPLLRTLTQHDPRQSTAWKWLAYLSPDPHEALLAARQLQALCPDDPWLPLALPALTARARNAPASDGLPPHRTTRPDRRAVAMASTLAAALLLVVVFTAMNQTQVARQARAEALVMDTEMISEGEEAASEAALAPGDAGVSASATQLAGEAPEDVDEVRPAVVPDVRVTETTNYYTFVASDEREIRDAVYKSGPLLKDGAQSIAMTSYQIWVEWKARQTVASCQMTQAVVHLDVTYTLPKWVPSGSPPDSLYIEWDRFSAHVADHEERHGELARQCANQLAERLEAVQSWPVCGDVEGSINVAVDEVYAACEQLQTAFDAEEGRTSFPLPADR